MNTIPLPGCTPEPLMSYLKALGVFRLVAEQADRSARGCWRGGIFMLETTLDRDGLTKFFLEQYKPTPIVAPWGARSGFYPGSSEATARAAIDLICSTTTERFEPFRSTVAVVRSILHRLGVETKADLDKGTNYLDLLLSLRNELPEGTSGDATGQWLDTVYVLTTGRGTDDRKFPPLLGTGGNEGSGSYVSTFAQVVGSLLVCRQGDGGLATALFNEMTSTLDSVAVGHFAPGAIGGPNSSQGFSGGGGTNPWDYLLAIEGTLLLRGTAARRFGTDTEGRASYPFCVEAIAVGYGSAADKEAAGTRAEVWMPLWSRSALVSEIRQTFGEGRVQLGRGQARNAVEFALAACTLGVSRGIDAFTRYAFVMRNGLSFFAAPLGRVAVTPRPAARLLEDSALQDWLDRLRSACREKDKTPARYQTALRDIDRAIFEFATRSELGQAADRRGLLDVLRALGRAERTLADGITFCKEKYIKPLQGLSSQWLEQTDDGSAEFALAAAVAGIGASDEVGPIREFLEEVEVKGTFVNWSPGSTSAVWSKRPLADNLAAVFRRRQMEAFRAGQSGVPLDAKRFAPLGIVLDFLNRNMDDDKLHDLIWGLSAVAWNDVTPHDPVSTDTFLDIPPEFGLPRLLINPLKLVPNGTRWAPAEGESEHATKPDPDVFHAIAAGRGDAVERAAHRLRAGGLTAVGHRNRQTSLRSLAVVSPHLRPGEANRLLAAMLFPLSNRDLLLLANAVLYPPETQE